MVLVVKNIPANAGDVRNMGLISGLGKFPGESMATHSVFMPGETHGQRQAPAHGVAKSQT